MQILSLPRSYEIEMTSIFLAHQGKICSAFKMFFSEPRHGFRSPLSDNRKVAQKEMRKQSKKNDGQAYPFLELIPCYLLTSAI